MIKSRSEKIRKVFGAIKDDEGNSVKKQKRVIRTWWKNSGAQLQIQKARATKR